MGPRGTCGIWLSQAGPSARIPNRDGVWRPKSRLKVTSPSTNSTKVLSELLEVWGDEAAWTLPTGEERKVEADSRPGELRSMKGQAER